VKLGVVCAGIVVLVGGTVAREVRAQTDPFDLVFRPALVDVAEASGLPRLDSAAVSSSVRREIRIYTGFGLGFPHEVVRLWEDGRGVRGQLGVFWPTGEPRRGYSSPDEERIHRAELRAAQTRLRAHVDTMFDCRATMQSRVMNVCWLDERPDRVVWARLLAQLDSLGIDSIPSPTTRRHGVDGWTIIVEVRRTTGYRSYYYWAPEVSSADAGERAAAKVATAVQDAFRRRLEK